jgi:hypothetical protein
MQHMMNFGSYDVQHEQMSHNTITNVANMAH